MEEFPDPYDGYIPTEYFPDEYYEEEVEVPRDSKIDEAKEELGVFFDENPTGVYYLKQLQVLHERLFFHWILWKAVNELVSDGFLSDHYEPLGKGVRLRFCIGEAIGTSGFRLDRR
ncbi:MAG: hypothetical protein E3J35_06285 [Methanomassiliicoccales archaeon]|nr:MAG: hypothetical protein E3J35_06285 [Methanomassiliicoccales archaeon]